MKKWLFIFLACGLTMTACGTTNNTSDETNGQTPAIEEPQENEATQPEDSEETNGDEPVSSDDNQLIRLPEQLMTYEVEGMKEEQTGFLKQSNNQDYSLYVMENYTMTEEEPGKDVISYNNNKEMWMRVELLEETSDLSQVEEETKAMMEAGFEEANKVEGPTGKDFNVVAAFEGQLQNEKGAAYVVEGNDHHPPLRLTIFAPAEAESYTPFMEMAKTIQK
ncbi:hypothetical protein [Metabacillus iocasae]|uniref:Lipoprotein n=1 Tax=Priestia iocasae TaxID=2291674 RepID=A0ABS2QRF7_9BACI|nr:hypothetical protein [Metabacillus iocasae]MBM7702040.1 hypothetical protein [Metabacillus iocasae]